MAKLILSMDGLILKEITLNKERMTIGRKAKNDIQIDNLAISGEHAALVTILNDSFLEDLNSTNGTLLNGQPIKKHFLKDGDVVELGKYKLKYIVEIQRDVTEFESNAAIPSDVAGVRPENKVAPPAPVANPTGRIQIIDGPNVGRELVLSKELTTLGKPGFQVAVVARRPSGYYAAHAEGASQPLLNGKALGAETRLVDGDRLEIAGVKMLFVLR